MRRLAYSDSLNPIMNLLLLIIKKGLFINFPSFDNSSTIFSFDKSLILKSRALKLFPLVLNIFFLSGENSIKANSKIFFEGGSITISIN